MGSGIVENEIRLKRGKELQVFERGQIVRVRAYPDILLERVVLKEEESYVLVCRPEVYRATKSGEVPEATMGFPKKDVIEAVAGVLSTPTTVV